MLFSQSEKTLTVNRSVVYTTSCCVHTAVSADGVSIKVIYVHHSQ